jgi:hypothetical protein
MVFPHAKEVGDIDLTNQPFKRSKMCLVTPKVEGMTHLVLSARFVFAGVILNQNFVCNMWKVFTRPTSATDVFNLYFSVFINF